MAAAFAEAWLAFAGALRLMRGDPGGMACFDPSIGGFWRSFRAGLLCYPFYLIILSFPVVIGEGPVAEIDPGRFYAVETIHFIISWVAFPLVALPIVDWLQRGDRFLGFVTAYNWCQAPQTLVFTAIALLGGAGILPPYAMLGVDLVLGLGALVYGWYIARVALAINGGQASLIVCTDMLLAVVLTHISRAIY
jgi:hypothetical protein